MAKSMQTQIMEALELALEADKYNMIVNHDYANTGIMWAVPEGNFSSRYSLHFSFHKDGATFRHIPGSGFGVPDKYIGIQYDNGEVEFTTNLQRVIDFLEGNTK
jgi:hypothetical protein